MPPLKPLILLVSIIILDTAHGDSLISSLLRNNLNRYLKNPLFTKSFVRNSLWNGEFGDRIPLQASESIRVNDFAMNGHNHQFGADNMIDAFGPMASNNDLTHLAMPDNLQHHPHPRVVPSIHPIPKTTNHRNVSTKVKPNSRENSKSLVLNENNVNAYSKPKNTDHNRPAMRKLNVPEPQNRYMDKNMEEKHNNMAHYNDFEDMQDGRNSHNHNLYNQEKALNLKMEYGFKPLPSSGPKHNSIQPETDVDTQETSLVHHGHVAYKPNESEMKKSKNVDQHNIYTSFEGSSNDLATAGDRDTKSYKFEKDELDLPVERKYITFPMENENSDTHKLAFAGTEAFKPDYDRSFTVTSGGHLFADILQNYPSISNFKHEGLACAREDGYCHYDSSYPKDYVNSVISECSSIIDSMYVEMPDNVTDFHDYKPFIQVSNVHQHKSSSVPSSLCDSDRKYIRPSVVRDVHGHFYLILQSSLYIQQIPVELCSSPGSPCNVVGECDSRVKCTQKYGIVNLISMESNEERDSLSNHHHHHHSVNYLQKTKVKCPRVKMFRMPTGCMCELSSSSSF